MLNTFIIKNYYFLLLISKLFYRLSYIKIFIKLDLYNIYYKLYIKKGINKRLYWKYTTGTLNI